MADYRHFDDLAYMPSNVKKEIYDKFQCLMIGYDPAIQALTNLGMTKADADSYLLEAVKAKH